MKTFPSKWPAAALIFLLPLSLILPSHAAERNPAALAALSNALLEAGKIPDESGKAAALASIAPVQARAGDVEGALETVGKIDKEIPTERTRVMRRGSALRKIAEAQARAGDVKGALLTAEKLTGADGQKDGFAHGMIAKAQAEAGDVEGATRTAEAIADPKQKETALKWIAAAKEKPATPATQGKVEAAPEPPASETDPVKRSAAYVAIAEALLKTSPAN